MITEDYVSFETAKLLKEKGFNEPCNNIYYETRSGFDLGLDPGYTNSHWEDWYKDMGVRNYSAPTLQMAMKWLREIHKIQLWTEPYEHEKGQYNAYVRTKWFIHQWQGVGYKSNEEACEEAIKYCLENLV